MKTWCLCGRPARGRELPNGCFGWLRCECGRQYPEQAEPGVTPPDRELRFHPIGMSSSPRNGSVTRESAGKSASVGSSYGRTRGAAAQSTGRAPSLRARHLWSDQQRGSKFGTIFILAVAGALLAAALLF